MFTEKQSSDLTRNDHFFKFWMPYLFQSISVPGCKWAFIPLNRNYKPLGMLSKDWIDYESCARSHGVIFKKNPTTVSEIWVHQDVVGENTVRLWLYQDANHSRKSYFDRLGRLMKMSIPVVGQKNAN